MNLITETLKQKTRLKIFGMDIFVPRIVILIAIGLALITLLIRYLLLQDQWRTLSVKWHGYAIDYPVLWGTTTYAASGGRGKNQDYLSASVNSAGPYVFIHQTEMEQPDLTDAFEWGQKIVRGREATNISSPTETQLGYDNYPALMQSYYDGDELIKAFFVITEKRAYMIEFLRVNEDSQPIANKNTQSIIDHMLASFRLYDEDGG